MGGNLPQLEEKKEQQTPAYHSSSSNLRSVVSSWLHACAYRGGRLLMKLLFAVGARLHVLRPETAKRSGGFVLAANHISHFDPFLISIVLSRKIDWLTMAGFFRNPLLGFLLRAINAFPAERNRAEISTIRAAVERLRNGRVVGLFPEGGIRDGARSVLEGAPARRGAAALACMAGGPFIPCVALGTNRLSTGSSCPPLRRSPVSCAIRDTVA